MWANDGHLVKAPETKGTDQGEGKRIEITAAGGSKKNPAKNTLFQWFEGIPGRKRILHRMLETRMQKRRGG